MAALHISALNCKELAVTLPAFLAIYDCITARRAGRFQFKIIRDEYHPIDIAPHPEQGREVALSMQRKFHDVPIDLGAQSRVGAVSSRGRSWPARRHIQSSGRV